MIVREIMFVSVCLWSSEDRTEDILKALNMISKNTCVRFHAHANEADYLHFEYGKG